MRTHTGGGAEEQLSLPPSSPAAHLSQLRRLPRGPTGPQYSLNTASRELLDSLNTASIQPLLTNCFHLFLDFGRLPRGHKDSQFTCFASTKGTQLCQPPSSSPTHLSQLGRLPRGPTGFLKSGGGGVTLWGGLERLHAAVGIYECVFISMSWYAPKSALMHRASYCMQQPPS